MCIYIYMILVYKPKLWDTSATNHRFHLGVPKIQKPPAPIAASPHLRHRRLQWPLDHRTPKCSGLENSTTCSLKKHLM